MCSMRVICRSTQHHLVAEPRPDRLDAQLIARYLKNEHEELHPYQLPNELQMQVDELIKRRHKLVVARQAQRQSLQALGRKLRSSTRLQRAFQAVIDEIDKRLQGLIAQDATLAADSKCLRTIVGFGPLLGAAMAHSIKRLSFANADAYVAYLGLDLRVRDSGKHLGRR